MENVILNIDKCMVLNVTLKKKPLMTSYFLHSHPLVSVSSANYLGVTINDSITTLMISAKKPTPLSFLHRNFVP